MQTIKALLNQIKWDKNLNPEEFTIFYLDRIAKKLIKIEYSDIKRIEDNFMVIEREEEVFIPLHRVKQVKQNNKIIWKRG